jgi:hypothetical protein
MNNYKYKEGVENIPLRKINTSMPALVLVYNLKIPDDKEALVLERKIDFANVEDRKWLGRITYWCMTNHHSIETISELDANGG